MNFTGKIKPPDRVIQSTFHVKFKSDGTVRKKGFQVFFVEWNSNRIEVGTEVLCQKLKGKTQCKGFSLQTRFCEVLKITFELNSVQLALKHPIKFTRLL